MSQLLLANSSCQVHHSNESHTTLVLSFMSNYGILRPTLPCTLLCYSKGKAEAIRSTYMTSFHGKFCALSCNNNALDFTFIRCQDPAKIAFINQSTLNWNSEKVSTEKVRKFYTSLKNYEHLYKSFKKVLSPQNKSFL